MGTQFFEGAHGPRSAAKLLSKDEVGRWQPAHDNGNHSVIWIKNNVSCAFSMHLWVSVGACVFGVRT
jgi:hypothetical protein